MSGVNRPGPCPGSVLSVSGYLTSPLKPHCLLTDLILNVVSHNVIFISANICEEVIPVKVLFKYWYRGPLSLQYSTFND